MSNPTFEEASEGRGGLEDPRLELGVELHSEVEGVLRAHKLANFHPLAGLVSAGEVKARFRESVKAKT